MDTGVDRGFAELYPAEGVAYISSETFSLVTKFNFTPAVRHVQVVLRD